MNKKYYDHHYDDNSNNLYISLENGEDSAFWVI